PARALDLADEQARDQEARDDEEDVHPDEAARDELDTSVIDQHKADRHGAQPFDLRTQARRTTTSLSQPSATPRHDLPRLCVRLGPQGCVRSLLLRSSPCGDPPVPERGRAGGSTTSRYPCTVSA